MDGRLPAIEQGYEELETLSVARRQALEGALALYRMFSEAGACQLWVEEKEQWLDSMVIPTKLEDLEVVQQRSVCEEEKGWMLLSSYPHKTFMVETLKLRFRCETVIKTRHHFVALMYTNYHWSLLQVILIATEISCLYCHYLFRIRKWMLFFFYVTIADLRLLNLRWII